MEIELEAVGRNLSALRTAQGLSLRELGELTGYTSSYLSQIERGTSTPSLSGLATMAAALGVEMARLFEEAAGPRIRITRSDEPLHLNAPAGPEGEAEHRYSVVGAHGNEGAYTALVHQASATAPPGTFRHFGERFCLVRAGAVTIEIAGEVHRLDAGDWLHYASHEDHTFEVVDETEATVLWIVSPAIF